MAIYLISLLPGLMVAALSRARDGWPLVLATLGVAGLQHAVNVLNDVVDGERGSDLDKAGSWLAFHRGRRSVALWHGWLSAVVGVGLGMAALMLTHRWWVLELAAPFVIVGLAYNLGPYPLAYTSLGEWVTGACYGPGVVLGLWLVATGTCSRVAVGLAVAFAALAMAVLLSHQPPQLLTDLAAGKRSFAVRHGVSTTTRVATSLFLLFCVALVVSMALAGTRFSTVLGVGLGALLSASLIGSPRPAKLLFGASLPVAMAWLAGM